MKDVQTDTTSKFWDAMEDISGGMLGLADGPLIPMTPMVREDAKDGKIWFITSKDTELFTSLSGGAKGARLVVADRGEGLWADIEGTLSAEQDAAILDEIWSPIAGAWFEEGKSDPDVRLMCFAPKSAEATMTEGNPVRFFYEIAKAKMTEGTPDLGGWKGKIAF